MFPAGQFHQQMKVRSPLLSLALVLVAAASAPAQSFWTGSTDGSLNNLANWTGPALTNKGLTFNATTRPTITVDAAITVVSLTFAGSFPTYTFSAPTGALLAIDDGGITVGPAGGPVLFSEDLPFQLSQSQTWTVRGANGLLSVAGSISSAPSTSTVLTKSGSGTLLLSGQNTFSGGVVVKDGTLLISAGPVTTAAVVAGSALGPGPVTLESSTSFGAASSNLTIGNDLVVGDRARLVSGSADETDTGLTLAGRITAATENILVHLLGTNPVVFAGTLDGPMNSVIRFRSGSSSGEMDGVAFTGTISAQVKSLSADGAALYFDSAESLPGTLEVKAVNGGYVSVGATRALLASPLPAQALLNRITQPALFAGTFGMDTGPGARPPQIYAEDMDFSAFSHARFQLGTTSTAVITGVITPPSSDTATAYRFGHSGGRLFVQSNLIDQVVATSGVTSPATVVVSTNGGSRPSQVVLSGVNTFSGTTTAAGNVANLRIDRAIVVLDAAGALPAAATFALEDRAYIGYTENAGFSSFSAFLSHVAANGHTANSVFGLDSRVVLQDQVTSGDTVASQGRRAMTGPVDLSSLTNAFLGTVTSLRISGAITAPSSHVLQVAGLEGSRITVASKLSATKTDGTANVTSVVAGYPMRKDRDDFGRGEVELTGANTYAGGTTLQSGALIVGNSSTFTGGQIIAGPLGLGALTVTAAPERVVLASNAESGATIYNPVTLNGILQLGRGAVDASLPGGTASVDSNRLILAGAISGSGGLLIDGPAILSGTNSYSGGTHAGRGGVIFATVPSLPALPVAGALTSEAGAYIGLASVPPSLQSDFIDRFDPVATHGTIGFDTIDNARTVFAGPISLAAFTSPTVTLGSATSARLTGLISPANTGYQFGGGNGYLEVTSNLTGASTGLDLRSIAGTSLTLRLAGVNTYRGITQVSDSALIWGTGALAAGSSFTMDTTGYIGTEDPAYDANFAGFLGRFDAGLNRGTIGFDAMPSGPTRTIATVLDLRSFTSGTPNFYIGTATALTFSSTSSIVLPTNATSYRFAGYKGGRLQVDTVLTGSKGLIIGNAAAPPHQVSSEGVVASVILNAANNFTGGTTFYAGNLYLGTSTTGGATVETGPLGIGSLTVGLNPFVAGQGQPTLRALGGPITLANSIILRDDLNASGGLTLTGAISGAGRLRKIETGTLVLDAANSSWTGGVTIDQGKVTFLQDSSGGTGTLILSNLVPTMAEFAGANPRIGALAGENRDAQLSLVTGAVLHIDQNSTTRFLGQITGDGARLSVQGLGPTRTSHLTLGGANLYTGGTSIGNHATVVAAHPSALGNTGTVTLNQGTLAVESGVTATFNTATHPLIINGGTLSGTGTFVFDSTVRVSGGSSGAAAKLAPGLVQPGRLNLSFTSGALILDSGGTYQWRLLDGSNATTGWDSVAVNGNVLLDATAAAPFNLTISSVAADGGSGTAVNFDIYSSYSWTLLTATSISGFDATKFNIDASLFLNRAEDGAFSLALDGAGTSLMLNYTAAAIPEPSTWALMIVGVAALLFKSWRDRRR